MIGIINFRKLNFNFFFPRENKNKMVKHAFRLGDYVTYKKSNKAMIIGMTVHYSTTSSKYKLYFLLFLSTGEKKPADSEELEKNINKEDFESELHPSKTKEYNDILKLLEDELIIINRDVPPSDGKIRRKSKRRSKKNKKRKSRKISAKNKRK